VIQVGSIRLVPVLSSTAPFAQWARRFIREGGFDRVAVDLPGILEPALREAVDQLPLIMAAVARDLSSGRMYVCCADPCDPMIEVLRLSASEKFGCSCVGSNDLRALEPVPALPDPYTAQGMGVETFAGLMLAACASHAWSDETRRAAHDLCENLIEMRSEGGRILAFVHLRHFAIVVDCLRRGAAPHSRSSRAPASYDITTHPVDIDCLYFALGELPYLTGRFEANRQDVMAGEFSFVDALREIFSETRDRMLESRDDIMAMSPARISCGLRFLRNLTVQSGSLMPDMFDILVAARGIGGDRFALKCLEQLKYYPFMDPLDSRPRLRPGIGRARIGDGHVEEYVNLLENREKQWRRIDLKPDPGKARKRSYRYRWNPSAMCSHLPEDRRIELFNAHVRSKAQRILAEDGARVEPFSASIKDGIDIRETIRHWYDGKIYVKEMPPARGSMDTVVIIFDGSHDEHYPHQVCWYAEHTEESTLTFYGTDPFADLLGPGVARCTYGGLSLLFPPRQIPSVFDLPGAVSMKSHAHRLVYGGLLFSAENSVAYVAEQGPDAAMRRMASRLGKRLVWLPLSTFSAETIAHLRRFHILNGHEVRSWASRFIGD